MKTQAFTSKFKAVWLRLLMVLLSCNLLLFGCEQGTDEVTPESAKLNALQVQTVKPANAKEDKDDKYKSDKTGQYVSKDVQVTGYEDGRERPTRPKYDSAGDLEAYSEVPCDPCGPGSGGVPTPPTSTFVSSEGVGDFVNGFSGDIYALRIIKGDHQYIIPSEGHIKLNADLNRGSGGKFIYLTFSRSPQYTYENYYNSPITYDTPITDLMAVSYSQVCYTFSGNFCDANPWPNWKYMFKYNGNNSEIVDLNDGTGGKYIFGHVYRGTDNGRTAIQEVGILYGNSSSILPPSGWIKYPQDLNESVGGDYIYFCYKR